MYRCQTHFHTANSTNVRKYFDICRHSLACSLVLRFALSLTRISFNFSMWLHFSVTPPTRKKTNISFRNRLRFFNFCSPRFYLFSSISFYLLDLTWDGVLTCQHFGCLIILTAARNFALFFSLPFWFEWIYLLAKTKATVQIDRLTIFENSSSWILNIDDCPFTLPQQNVIFNTFDREIEAIFTRVKNILLTKNTGNGTDQRQSVFTYFQVEDFDCLLFGFIFHHRNEMRWNDRILKTCHFCRARKVKAKHLLHDIQLEIWKKTMQSIHNGAKWILITKNSTFRASNGFQWMLGMCRVAILRCNLRSETWKYNK